MFWSDILLLSAAGGVPTYQPYTGTHAATNQKNGAFSFVLYVLNDNGSVMLF